MAEETEAAGFVLDTSGIEQGNYTENFEYNGFTIAADETHIVSVSDGAGKLGDIFYTNKICLGGTGTIDYRNIKFETEKSATVIVHARASSATESRYLGVGTYNETRKRFEDVGKVIVEPWLDSYQISLLDAGTYYIYSKNSGININYVEVSYAPVQAEVKKESYDIPEEAPDFKEGDLYVSVNGRASAAGTFENPMNLATALEKIPAGNTIWMFGGYYYMDDLYGSKLLVEPENSGSENAYKKISSINGRRVVLDFDGSIEHHSNKGFVLAGDYWHVYDIDICNAGSQGMLICGNNNIVELCKFYSNGDSGLQISRYNSSQETIETWPSNNLVLNCTSYDNFDTITIGENADGFAPKLTCGEGNVFDGCISYCNSDDGWDMFCKDETGSIGSVTLKNCVTFANGIFTDGTPSDGNKNGYKLGGRGHASPHIVENCLAFDNVKKGFDDNNNGGAISLKNCTSVDNLRNYSCNRASVDATYDNLVSFSREILEADSLQGTISHMIRAHQRTGYTWIENWYCTEGWGNSYYGNEKDDYTISENDFVNVTVPKDDNGNYSLDYHEFFRNSDGSINLDGLYEIKESSPLYTAGSNGDYIGANFSKGANTSEKHMVTVETVGNGTVTVSVPRVADGANVILDAVAGEGYEFAGWEVVSGDVEIIHNEFIMPESDVQIKAVFAEISPENPVKFFVDRMYTVALGREADEAGVDNWVAALNAGTHDGAGIAAEFILGDEFALRGLSDEQYVDTLYRTFFNREADADGKALWLAVLSAGQTREYVLSNFVNLDEFTMLCAEYGIERGVMLTDGVAAKPGISQFVKRMYTIALGREAENDGLYNNVLALVVGALTAEDVAKNFFTSEEYTTKGKDDLAYVADLYMAFMNREADATGLSFWVDTIAVGMSRDAVLSEFAASAEFKAIAASYGLN